MIRVLIDIYCLILIINAVLSYLPQFRNEEIVKKINQIAEFSLKPVRKFIPNNLPFDVSPIVVILALKLFIALF